jgi:type II protein arginine methyltransferase
MVDCDSKFEHVRLRSEAIITQEINFAMHLSVNAIVLDFPQGPRVENFSRLIASYTQNVSTSATKFLLRIEISGNFADAEATY